MLQTPHTDSKNRLLSINWRTFLSSLPFFQTTQWSHSPNLNLKVELIIIVRQRQAFSSLWLIQEDTPLDSKPRLLSPSMVPLGGCTKVDINNHGNSAPDAPGSSPMQVQEPRWIYSPTLPTPRLVARAPLPDSAPLTPPTGRDRGCWDSSFKQQYFTEKKQELYWETHSSMQRSRTKSNMTETWNIQTVELLNIHTYTHTHTPPTHTQCVQFNF